MAASHKSPDKDEPVVIDKVFIRAQVTQAANQFFLPITSVFRVVTPSFWAAGPIGTKKHEAPRTKPTTNRRRTPPPIQGDG
jgi:hypothetical protein